MTRPAASKYLQHKWEAQQFREHRQRVGLTSYLKEAGSTYVLVKWGGGG